jgi:hypothetical protein
MGVHPVPMRPAARSWGFVLPAVLCGIGACADEPPGCRTSQVVSLPQTALTSLPDVRLHRVGDAFALSGYDPRSGTVRFAHLTSAGELGSESTLLIPAPKLGPFFAPVGKAAPGDQLLVVYGEGAAGGALALQLRVLDTAASTAGPPRPLSDPMGAPVVLDPAGLQLALGGSQSGRYAVVAWGRGDRASVPAAMLLKADGTAAPLPDPLSPQESRWDCLAITRGRSALGISWVGRAGANPVWHFTDLREDGSTAYALDADVPTPEMECPAVAPAPDAYTIAWQNRDGTYFSHVDTTRDPVTLTSDIVKAAVRFGGPERQPRIACIAPMAREFGIAYDPGRGPSVDRFNIFGNPRGGTLRLPTRGHTEATSGWGTVDALFLTYLDRGPSASLDRRTLVRIECPQL